MLVRDGDQHSAEGTRPHFEISQGNWKKRKDDEGPRLKSMSEMRHDLIVHETNEDL